MRTIQDSVASDLGGATGKKRTPHPPRLLVVDDEPEIRETLADILISEGYSVDTAANGAEALREVEKHPVDLVLLDLTMPVMDGWSFFSAVRRDPRTAKLPVVAVSAMPDSESAGFTARLRKPFDLDRLLTTVAGLCQAA
jgi:CheY-like chemotaxis protein